MKPLLFFLLSLICATYAGITDEPVDDQRIQSSLLKFGQDLLDTGKATKAADLRAQFNRRLCKVSLLPQAEKADALPAVAARLRPGTAVVGSIYKCTKCTKWHSGTASGFFISSDGIFVTNHHVIAKPDAETFVVLSGDGRMTPVTELLATDPVADVAILRCAGSGFTALPLGVSSIPDGDPVGVWSHPNSHYFSLSSGVVARRFLLRKGTSRVEALAITADYARGSSGGPVFDFRGNVVGMVASTSSVYYDEDKDHQKDLQMVFKNCVSVRSIAALIEPQSAK